MGLVAGSRDSAERHIREMQATGFIDVRGCVLSGAELPDLPVHGSIDALLEHDGAINAVILATRERVMNNAWISLYRGRHVMLQPLYGLAPAQLGRLVTIAEEARRTVFQPKHWRQYALARRVRGQLCRTPIQDARFVWFDSDSPSACDGPHTPSNELMRACEATTSAISVLQNVVPETLSLQHVSVRARSAWGSTTALHARFGCSGGGLVECELDFSKTKSPRRCLHVFDGRRQIVANLDSGEATIDGEQLRGGDGAADCTDLYRRFCLLMDRRVSQVADDAVQLATKVLRSAGLAGHPAHAGDTQNAAKAGSFEARAAQMAELATYLRA